MDMSINRSRKDVKAMGIDHFWRVIFQRLGDPDDLFLADIEDTRVDTLGVDQKSVDDGEICFQRTTSCNGFPVLLANRPALFARAVIRLAWSRFGADIVFLDGLTSASPLRRERG